MKTCFSSAMGGSAFRVVTASTLAALTLGLGGPVFAQGVDDEEPAPVFQASFNKAEIADARNRASQLRRSADERGALAKLKAQLQRSAAQDGVTLLDEDTTAFKLNEHVSVAAPKGARFSRIDVRSTAEGSVIAEAETESSGVSSDASVSAASQGHGMGWRYQHSNVYVIKIRGVGEMESRFKKYKFVGDGPDLSSMRRKGMGRAYDINGFNYSVTGLYISSHVRDKDKWKVRYRWSSKPSSDFNGNCDNNNYSLGIKGLGWSFNDCDRNDIAYSASNPGYYRNYMKQGALFSRGDREVAFHNVVAVKNGKTNLAYKHYQRLEMARWSYPAKKCSSWTSSNTCSG